MIIRVSGDQWTYIVGGRDKKSYQLVLNTTAQPKEIDLVLLRPDGTPATNTHGPGAGSPVALHGIYTLEETTARVILAPGGEKRPTSLEDPGTSQVLNLEKSGR